jgi:hypothetical protein
MGSSACAFAGCREDNRQGISQRAHEHERSVGDDAWEDGPTDGNACRPVVDVGEEVGQGEIDQTETESSRIRPACDDPAADDADHLEVYCRQDA